MTLLSPSARRLAAHPHIRVTEEDEWWIKGHFVKEMPTAFELSHELWDQIPDHAKPRVFIHPEVPVVYLGMFCGRLNLMEFHFGKWALKPRDLDTTRQLALLLSLLKGVRPMAVAGKQSASIMYSPVKGFQIARGAATI